MKLLEFFNETENCQLRTALIGGIPHFVARDVCDALDISNSRDAVAQLDNDERADVGITDTSSIRKPGQRATQTMACITESGLYALIFTSRKPAARAFRKWVTSVVLPALRRTGMYSMVGKVPAESIRVRQLELQLRAARLREDATCALIESELIWVLEGGVPLAAWLQDNKPNLNVKQRANLVRTVKVWAEREKLPAGRARHHGGWALTLLPEHIDAYFEQLTPA